MAQYKTRSEREAERRQKREATQEKQKAYAGLTNLFSGGNLKDALLDALQPGRRGGGNTHGPRSVYYGTVDSGTVAKRRAKAKAGRKADVARRRRNR